MRLHRAGRAPAWRAFQSWTPPGSSRLQTHARWGSACQLCGTCRTGASPASHRHCFMRLLCSRLICTESGCCCQGQGCCGAMEWPLITCTGVAVVTMSKSFGHVCKRRSRTAPPTRYPSCPAQENAAQHGAPSVLRQDSYKTAQCHILSSPVDNAGHLTL